MKDELNLCFGLKPYKCIHSVLIYFYQKLKFQLKTMIFFLKQKLSDLKILKVFFYIFDLISIFSLRLCEKNHYGNKH